MIFRCFQTLSIIFALLMATSSYAAYEFTGTVDSTKRRTVEYHQFLETHQKLLKAESETQPAKKTKLSWIVDPQQSQALLQIRYALECQDSTSFVVGKVFYQDRVIRVLLFEGREIAEVLLGALPETSAPIRVVVDELRGCTLSEPSTAISYVSYTKDPDYPTSLDYPFLVMKHLPFLKIGKTFNEKRIPLTVAYRNQADPSGPMTVSYYVYWNGSPERDAPEQIDKNVFQTGFKGEAQKIFEVQLTAQGIPRNKRYLSSGKIWLNFPSRSNPDHLKYYLPESENPILQISNMDSSLSPAELDKNLDGFHPSPRLVGYSPAGELNEPEILMNELIVPKSKDWLWLHQPWLLRTVDLQQQNTKFYQATDYLFVLVNGILHPNNQVRGLLTLKTDTQSETFESAPENQGLTKLDPDGWEKESFIAIPIGKKNIQKIRSGEVTGTFQLETMPNPAALTLKYGLRFLTVSESGRSYQPCHMGPTPADPEHGYNELTPKFGRTIGRDGKASSTLIQKR